MTPGSQLTIPLQGGLGNQLFELSAGLALTARTGRRVVFTDHWLTHPAPGETPRNFALAGLLRAEEFSRSPVRRGTSRTDVLLRRRVMERTPDDDTLARVGPSTRLVAGYFQHIDYVHDAWDELSRRLTFSEDPRHKRLVQATGRNRYGAVHYRLGDYASNPQARAFHGVTPPSYFASLIRRHSQEDDVKEWAVVSDEPERALALIRQEHDLPDGIRLVGDHSDEWGALATLAGAEVLGISNSSFSWWAGYIAWQVRSARVVAPQPWFADARTPEPHLFPESWHRLERLV